MKRITVLDLLTHTSGLGRLPENLQDSIKDMNDPYKDYGETQLLQFLQFGELENKRGTIVYSNAGYGLLGYLLEKVYFMPYATVLKQNVLDELRMTSSIIYERGIDMSSEAQGYNSSGIATPCWTMNALQGAGGLLSTAEDMGTLFQQSQAEIISLMIPYKKVSDL